MAVFFAQQRMTLGISKYDFECHQSWEFFRVPFQCHLPRNKAKMDGWNTSFFLGWPIFRGELLVSGRVRIP